MWKTPKRGIAASAVALAMLLTGTAQPAHANPDGFSDQIVDATVIGVNIYRARGATPDQIAELIRIVSAILGIMESDVKTQADGLVAAEILGRTVSVQDDWRDYHVIRQDDLGTELFAQRVNAILNDAIAKFPEVGRRAKDQVTLAAQTLYPVVLTARTDAGYTEGLGAIEGRFRSHMFKVILELEPRCTPTNANPEPTPGETATIWECVAADGRKAAAYERSVGGVYTDGPVDLWQLKLEAAKHSSWTAAVRIINP